MSYYRTLSMAIAFLLVIVFIWKCRRHLWLECRKVPVVYVLALVLLEAAAGVFYTYFIPAKYLVFSVPRCLNVAVDILMHGHIGDWQKSAGWPFLIFLGYLWGGVSSYTGIQLSQIFAAGVIIAVFFLARWSGASLLSSFISAILVTLIPIRFFCGSMGEPHAAYLFFVVSAAAVSFLFFRSPDRNMFYLFAFLWIATVLIRGETIFLFAFFLIASWFLVPKYVRKELPWAFLLCVTGTILVPHLIPGFSHVFYQHRLVGQADVSLGNFLHNISHYGWPFFSGRAHPVLLTLFAVVGAVFLYGKNKKVVWVLAGWLLVLSLVYFSMWMQVYAHTSLFLAKMQLLLFFYPPLVLFSSHGILWFSERFRPWFASGVVVIMLVAIAFLYIPYYSEYLLGFEKASSVVLLYGVDPVSRNGGVAVTCAPEFFDDVPLALESMIVDPSIFNTFKQRVSGQVQLFLVENTAVDRVSVFGRGCQEGLSLIKEKGRAVFFKRVIKGNMSYNIYYLFLDHDEGFSTIRVINNLLTNNQ